MSKFDDKLATYTDALKALDSGADMDLLAKITKGLGPSIYNNDSNKVACSQKTELERVVNNYGIKKLGADKEAAEKAVQAACETYKDSRSKHRAVFYYLVCKELGKEDVYA